MNKSPYDIIKSRYMTEKAKMLQDLKDNESNRSVRRCENAKYVFLVEDKANKIEIARALEQIYAKKGIRVSKVNTVMAKPKKRRVRGRAGMRPGFKKAIITLAKGDSLDDEV